MEPPAMAAQSPPLNADTPKDSYADKLKGNNIPQERAARAARKAFVQGVDTNVIGTSDVLNGRKTIFLSKEEDNYMAAPFEFALVGKPIKLDEATSEIENPVVARICVEVNIMEKLIPGIPIQIEGRTKFYKVQYQGIPEYCRICQHRGHSMAACFVRKEGEEENVVNSDNSEESRVDLQKDGDKSGAAGIIMSESVLNSSGKKIDDDKDQCTSSVVKETMESPKMNLNHNLEEHTPSLEMNLDLVTYKSNDN
ncbi:hypothetical protein BUALT_Bualt03G0220700 [Buddleja alternifolia]|uniref:DUF4283 domain-containing protein n=1 Tax=Buddleja alternifolia TaxID=168488 RepID=A0AAV6Y063_9LAMI|nr:hypothetical protein BUALT_Bualt03G0220700 [Buddleja alternifolia]